MPLLDEELTALDELLELPLDDEDIPPLEMLDDTPELSELPLVPDDTSEELDSDVPHG